MKITLGEYCAGLAASPERLKLFSSSEHEAREDMLSAGLDRDRLFEGKSLQDVLLSGDTEAIKRALNAETSLRPGGGNNSLLHSITLTIPHH